MRRHLMQLCFAIVNFLSSPMAIINSKEAPPVLRRGVNVFIHNMKEFVEVRGFPARHISSLGAIRRDGIGV